MEKPLGISEEDLRKDLLAVDVDINENAEQIKALQERRMQLKARRQRILDTIKTKNAEAVISNNFDGEDFPWSAKLVKTLASKFRLSELRPYQLPTMNAVMSGHDCILVMPTSGGKSLCFQLPALLLPGKTLVVSPLVALMEDQVMALQELNIPVAMFSASMGVAAQNKILKEMVSSDSALKIVYVTPEKLAKSKRIKATIEKMYHARLLSLVAIDEVHCCSQWGHDFRPDYKALGVLKRQFPNTPILGLTATSTTRVTHDVQQMLCIENCLVFRASFNRPNLVYQVRPKPASQKEALGDIANLILRCYPGQSGIVYCLSIRESEEVATGLQERGIEAHPYHAQLEAEVRSRVHRSWIANQCQVVVATIAFGMGIDKPDVRFVIHHSLSKSVENYYQESGRCGRDKKSADCILFYRLSDVFRLSPMAFSEITGLANLYTIVAYCIEQKRCRRSILAQHFGEMYEPADCNKMCDTCNPVLAPSGYKHVAEVDITKFCRNIYDIIDQAALSDQRLTALKVVDAWLGKGASTLRVKDLANPGMSREGCERVMAFLLLEGYVKEDFHFTPYTTVSYMAKGPRAAAVIHGKHIVKMNLTKDGAKSKSLSSKSNTNLSPTTLNKTHSSPMVAKEANSAIGKPASKVCIVNRSNSKVSKSSSSTGLTGKTSPMTTKASMTTPARGGPSSDSGSDMDTDLEFGEWDSRKLKNSASFKNPTKAIEIVELDEIDWNCEEDFSKELETPEKANKSRVDCDQTHVSKRAKT